MIYKEKQTSSFIHSIVASTLVNNKSKKMSKVLKRTITYVTVKDRTYRFTETITLLPKRKQTEVIDLTQDSDEQPTTQPQQPYKSPYYCNTPEANGNCTPGISGNISPYNEYYRSPFGSPATQ